ELRQAIRAAREVCQLPLVAQLSFAEDGRTLTGASPAQVAQALQDLGVEVFGVNCGLGPQLALDLLRQMAVTGDAFLSAQPNAGFPSRLEGRYLYVSTPDYFADYARRFAESGVRLIGGCCGTTPQHIAAMRQALQGLRPEPEAPAPRAVVLQRPDESLEV